MIELPEVETMRRDLEREAVGKRIKAVDVKVAKAVSRSGTRKKFASRIEKAKITRVRRKGLYLLLDLDNGEVLICALGQSGRLRRTANKDEVESDTTVIITFTQQGQLRLIDPAGGAQMFVVAAHCIDEEVPEIAALGIDPVEEPMSWIAFGEILLERDLKLKTLLEDQTVIAGLGEMYADEILFNAGLRYDRTTHSLSAQEIRRFYRALVETLHEAIKYRGTTLSEDGFTDVFGEPGSFQEHLNVYRREGELSPRSRRPIVRSRFGNRWTYYCEQSQV